jgi:wobble nucleotide-excising tRNase
MTDRLKGFIVTLERDIRDDDAEVIKQAIAAIRYVLSVAPVVADINDHMNRQRIRAELVEKLYAALEEKE